MSLAPKPQRRHLLASHAGLLLVVAVTLILVQKTPAQGWHKLAMPLAVFGWLALLWAAAYLLLSMRGSAGSSDWFRHVSVRLYSVWFLLCTCYGAWIIWGYPQDANHQLAFLAAEYPFQRPATSMEATWWHDLLVWMVKLWSLGVKIVYHALELLPGIDGHRVGLFPDFEPGIIGDFLARQDKQTVLTTIVPALAVFAFATPATLAQFARRDVETRDKWLEEIANDTYFIGFLLTLAGLSSALVGIKPGTDNLLVALGKAGGAISTTFVAVIMRVLVLDIVSLAPTKSEKGKEETAKDDTITGVLTEMRGAIAALLGRNTPSVVPLSPLPTQCVMLGTDCQTCLSPCVIAKTKSAVDRLQDRWTEPPPRDDGAVLGAIARAEGAIAGRVEENHGRVMAALAMIDPMAATRKLDQGLNRLTEELRQCCDEMGKRLEAAQRTPPADPGIAAIAAAVERLAADLADFKQRLTEAVAPSPEPDPRVQAIEQALAALAARLDALDRRLARLAAPPASTPEPDWVGSLLAEIQDMHARLGQELKRIKDDLRQPQAMADPSGCRTWPDVWMKSTSSCAAAPRRSAPPPTARSTGCDAASSSCAAISTKGCATSPPS